MSTYDDEPSAQGNKPSTQENKLSALYKLQATEQPAKELDKKILALAKAAPVSKKPRLIFRSLAPYSIVASMAIAGLLFLSFPEYYQINPSTIAPDFKPQPKARSPQPARSPQQESSPQPELSLQRGESTQPAKKLQRKISTQAESVAGPQNLIQQAAPEPARPQFMADEILSDEAKAIDQNIISAGQAMKKQRTASKISTELTDIQRDMLQKIDKLLADNKEQQAIELLKQLKQQNPELLLEQKYQQLLDQANELQ